MVMDLTELAATFATASTGIEQVNLLIVEQ